MRYRSRSPDPLSDLPTGEPASRRERWRAAIYITTAATLITLVVLAVVFDQFAATGVLVVVFLSFVLAYLIAPGVEQLRHRLAPSRRGRPLSRSVAVLVIYGLLKNEVRLVHGRASAKLFPLPDRCVTTAAMMARVTIASISGSAPISGPAFA